VGVHCFCPMGVQTWPKFTNFHCAKLERNGGGCKTLAKRGGALFLSDGGANMANIASPLAPLVM
jgi:hypothetical protein